MVGPAAAASWTVGKGAAVPPPGYLSMCRAAPSVCAGDRAPGAGPFAASAADLDRLIAVNIDVNRAIAPAQDHADHWAPNAVVGDCEDYALAKRQRLIALGWAPSQLLIAVAEDPDQGPHAVLIARTDRGDLVLDNLTDQVLPWAKTRPTFISRQSEKLPALWVKL